MLLDCHGIIVRLLDHGLDDIPFGAFAILRSWNDRHLSAAIPLDPTSVPVYAEPYCSCVMALIPKGQASGYARPGTDVENISCSKRIAYH